MSSPNEGCAALIQECWYVRLFGIINTRHTRCQAPTWKWGARQHRNTKMTRARCLVILLLSAVPIADGVFARSATAQPNQPLRRIVDLNGIWQVAEGQMATVPTTFPRTVPVPGLIDMAAPGFEDVGKASDRREAFWYRRTFRVDGEIPARAVLKINKAKYGSKVFLNGQLVGEHLPSFTPGYFDVSSFLNGDGAENELTVGLGAHRESLPEGQPGGWDFEKYRYIPGIYDDVRLILTGEPYIVNVQTVPDIEAEVVRVVAEIEPAPSSTVIDLKAEVAETSTKKVVGTAVGRSVSRGQGQVTTIEVVVPIARCRLWSPEDPFLYQLRLTTGADEVRVRFGMRSFRFDPKTNRALLNGKPYMMRGTNVTVYRFFEDAERADRPWRDDWVRRLHRKFKTMHWNSIRYCIGFPPERWYEIADEEGFLVQDEFPIWLLDKAPEQPMADKIIPEYTAWMRERWNHPSVVIWDAQNESVTAETGKAIQAVRYLDLSNRPWENGWSEPQSPTDVVETHPYVFQRGAFNEQEPPFRLWEMATRSGKPPLRKRQAKLGAATLINEYGWLWLTRDGQPTSLTRFLYDALLGQEATVEQRRHLHARYLAALTEFWRAHRQTAGVLHFVGLGYSRPGDKPRPEGGATSDHFIDLEQLTFEPLFETYVGDAFNPVGLMLDFWAEDVPLGEQRAMEVVVVNDRNDAWEGEVQLRILRDDERFSTQTQPIYVEGLGRQVLLFTQAMPETPGSYTIAAELADRDGRRVRSLRDFEVKP
ncbi:MAG: hypothetical protein GEU99_08300 [Luteitalea sp.]|nr:hypothetical protein [Luteitalea sp.]